MIIEMIPLKLASLNLDHVKMTNEIIGFNKKQNLRITSHQFQALEQIAKSKNIHDIIHYFLQNKTIPSFLAIRDLLKFLVDEGLILNPELKNYFHTPEAPPPKSLFDDLMNKVTGEPEASFDLEKQLDTTPFFRSLEPQLKDVFLKNVKLVDAPENISICTQGQLQRSLFAILKGEATVYKKDSTGKRHRIATLQPGSVFGETGFFMNEPRTADVVTSKKSLVARFKYLPDVFDGAIKADHAKGLQKRFWMIHALLKSDVFKHLPEDCFDALLFAGKPVSFAPDQTIFKEGDTGDACYLIIQGKVVISQKGNSINVLDQGGCFGEIALILNRGQRTASAKAQSQVLAMEIPSDKFYALLSENLWLGCEFERIALERWQKDQQR